MFHWGINEGSQYVKKTMAGFTSELFVSLKVFGYFGISCKNDDLLVVKRDAAFFRGMRHFSNGVCRYYGLSQSL